MKQYSNIQSQQVDLIVKSKPLDLPFSIHSFTSFVKKVNFRKHLYIIIKVVQLLYLPHP